MAAKFLMIPSSSQFQVVLLPYILESDKGVQSAKSTDITQDLSSNEVKTAETKTE